MSYVTMIKIYLLMGRQSLKIAAVPAAALLSVALVAACGGTAGSSGSGVETGPLQVSGGGVAQFRERGADNSIEEYGHEASKAELEQAAADVHGYLAARVEEDWSAACSYLSKSFRQRLAAEAPKSDRVTRDGCAVAARTYSPPVLRSERYESSLVNAGSLRIKGNYGFLFFNAGHNGHKILMVREGGSWMIAANLTPTSLH